MSNQAETLVQQGEQELINENWAVALDKFNEALAVLGFNGDEPTQSLIAEANNGKGVALLELERYGESVKALESAITYNANLASAYYNLGVAWESLGIPETALRNYNRTLELEPQDGEAYFRRGGVYFTLEQFEKTIEDTTRALELHGASSPVATIGPLIARGLAFYRLERYQPALEDFGRALAIDPRGASNGFFYRALVYIDRGEALPARADLQAYLTLTDDLNGILAEQAREIIAELDSLP